jgi:proteasome lid subunit RPN8/RPN11
MNNETIRTIRSWLMARKLNRLFPKRHLRPRAAFELPPRPVLRFSPTAWAKLLCLRDLGPTEVGGFAITSAEDLLLVQDVRLVRQECSGASVSLDDGAVADFYDEQVDQGRKPEEFSRIWLHTHPGNSPRPSSTDEATFARVCGRAQWALMFILAASGDSHARLRFNVGPGGSMAIPVVVDYARPFAASDSEAWAAEYHACVRPASPWSADPWDPLSAFGLSRLPLDIEEEQQPAGRHLSLRTEDFNGYP